MWEKKNLFCQCLMSPVFIQNKNMSKIPVLGKIQVSICSRYFLQRLLKFGKNKKDFRSIQITFM